MISTTNMMEFTFSNGAMLSLTQADDKKTYIRIYRRVYNLKVNVTSQFYNDNAGDPHFEMASLIPSQEAIKTETADVVAFIMSMVAEGPLKELYAVMNEKGDDCHVESVFFSREAAEEYIQATKDGKEIRKQKRKPI